MENFIEAYGTFQNKMLFVAVRFQKPIVRVQIADTSNTLVVPQTFLVGSASELLLASLNKSDIYYYSYHNSVLYLCGSLNSIPFRYTRIPKTITFKALYRISKACQKGKINIDQIVLCSYFKRNNLKWQNWKSWWCFVRNIVNDTFKDKVSRNITLQMVKLLKRAWRSSCRVKNTYSIPPELSFCEITLEKTENPGILCDSMKTYVSPMIVSYECFDFLPIVDKARVKCDRWFPLYTNKHNWFDHLIYFYVRVNIEDLKSILLFLKNNTTVVKHKLIRKNVYLIYRLLTCNS